MIPSANFTSQITSFSSSEPLSLNYLLYAPWHNLNTSESINSMERLLRIFAVLSLTVAKVDSIRLVLAAEVEKRRCLLEHLSMSVRIHHYRQPMHHCKIQDSRLLSVCYYNKAVQNPKGTDGET